MAWYYWINFPLWMASLAFLFPETISMITGMEIGLVPSLAIASCLAKYLYKKTGSVYVAAFLNTILMTMMTVANTAIYFQA